MANEDNDDDESFDALENMSERTTRAGAKKKKAGGTGGKLIDAFVQQ